MKSFMLVAAVLLTACFAAPSVSSANDCCKRFPVARKVVRVVAVARPVNWVRPRCCETVKCCKVPCVRFPVARRTAEVGVNVVRGGINLLRPRCCR